MKVVTLILFATLVLIWPRVFAADTSVATIQISGFVPERVTVTTTTVTPEITFTPYAGNGDGDGNGNGGNMKILGFMHFVYNTPVAAITISSDTVTGQPEDGNGRPYSIQGMNLYFSVLPGCVSVDSSYNFPFELTSAGTDIKSQTAANPPDAVDENCTLTAAWIGNPRRLPMAGKFHMNVKVVLVSY